MNPELRKPRERTCELCGREEVWDESVGSWILRRDDDGEPTLVGSLYCIHEWDIDGTFDPVVDSDRGVA
jgi:hypothetical protein